jgi:NarL family two-component system response regulator LiaR
LGKVSSNGGSELNVEEPIRVVIADDQRLFANGLARIIGVQPDMEVVGEAHTGEEAISLCLREEPDVVLMDLSMPGMGGLSATRKILSLLPRTRVLILTVHTDDAHVFQGIEAGAQGYILKDCTPEDLTRAIRAVHAGDTIMSQDIARKMLTTFEGIRSNTEITPNLTERELQVIMALAQGKSNKEIARDLDISEKTVRNHASNIYKKLHIFDRTQAVIYAIREGLVDLEDLGAR